MNTTIAEKENVQEFKKVNFLSQLFTTLDIPPKVIPEKSINSWNLLNYLTLESHSHDWELSYTLSTFILTTTLSVLEIFDN